MRLDKTSCLVLTLALLLPIGAKGDVYSLNAVCVLRFDLEAGVPELIPVQVVPAGQTTEPFPISLVLGTNGIPGNTQVKISQPGSGNYVLEVFEGGAWSPGTATLKRGDAFWITSPSNYVLRIAGYVPDAQNAATTTVSVAEGLQIVGYPYPTSGNYEQATLGTPSPGDTLIHLNADGTTQRDASSYFGHEGWHPAPSGFEIGQAWWYRSVSNRTWTTVKPYDYP